MSLLTLVQDAADRLGIVRPSTVIGSADQQVRQLLGLANQEGKELARRHTWQATTFEKTLTATATETQSGAIPTDFDRFIPDTFHNRSLNRKVQGPLNAQEWQDYKASVTTVLWDAFRQRGDALLLAPTPTAGHTYAFEYMSKFWCTAIGGTTATLAAWNADTDVGILSEDLMCLGVIWRFLKAKGLDYSEPFRTYEAQLMMMMARDGGKRHVNMAMARNYSGPYPPQFPDGSWPLT